MSNEIDMDAKQPELTSAPPKEEAHLWMRLRTLNTTDGDNALHFRWVRKSEATLEFEEDQKIKAAIADKRKRLQDNKAKKAQLLELEELEKEEAELEQIEKNVSNSMKKKNK